MSSSHRYADALIQQTRQGGTDGKEYKDTHDTDILIELGTGS